MADLVQSLVRIRGILMEAGIESAVIGGMALAVRGEPRYTKDVDIKVILDRDEASRLLEAMERGPSLGEGYRGGVARNSLRKGEPMAEG